MEGDYQRFLATHGSDLPGNPRELTFCRHFEDVRDVAVVPDAAADGRFAANPLVAGAPGLRFYAGAPMVTPEGHALGTVCVFDTAPRDGLTAVVSVKLDRPQFEGATRDVLGNAEVRESVASAVRDRLIAWLAEDPRSASVVVGRIAAGTSSAGA